MPPTFLIFLGFTAYVGLTAITLVVFGPMLLIDSKKLLAKKVISTVLISFPCLIAMGLFCVIVFLIPALVFFWLTNSGYIPRTPGIALAIIGFLIFSVTVATTSLYLWFFMSKIIYQRLDKKPIKEFIDNDRVFGFLRSFMIKLKIYKPTAWQKKLKYLFQSVQSF